MADAYLTQGGGFSLSGSNAPRHSCVDCGALVWPGSTRCKGCYGRTRNTPTETRCLSCLNLYVPKKSDRATFCSRGCAFLDWALNGHPAKPDRRRWEDWSKAQAPRVNTKCVLCKRDAKSPNAKYCGSACAKRAQQYASLRSFEPIHCRACGVMFCRLPGTWARSCGPECAQSLRLQASKKNRMRPCSRAAKALRAARKRNARAGDSFDPLDTLARDGWRCQLCGVRTPKSKRGSCADDAPEVDHVIPLARGGVHALWNTQCLCRRCNSRKGATALGQLSLQM